MDVKPLLAIIRFTVLELFRTRLWIFALMMTAILAGIAVFTASLAITESFEYRVVSYANLTRLIAAFVVALFVANSVNREIEEGTLDLIVSRPVSKTTWYVGKLSGYFIIVGLFSILCVLPFFVFEVQYWFVWWASFLAELYILTAAALAFAITLRSTTVAVTALVGFYVLCRIIGALVLMSSRAAIEIAQPINGFVAQIVRGIAYLLPDLSRFASTPVLLGNSASDLSQGLTPIADVMYIGTQLVIYCVLLSCVGLFDLHRRNL